MMVEVIYNFTRNIGTNLDNYVSLTPFPNVVPPHQAFLAFADGLPTQRF